MGSGTGVPEVAKIMAKELRFSRKWRKSQVMEYRDLAQGYLLDWGAVRDAILD